MCLNGGYLCGFSVESVFCVSECGGKMHLREEEYDKAATDFFEVTRSTLTFFRNHIS